MVSMKALMSLSQYDMGVLDGIAKVKDMLQENNSCNVVLESTSIIN